MARPLKESLDYFPLDIDFDQDDKLVVPLAKYGMLGLGIIVKIMAEVYRNGYFYPWTEREHYVFSNRVNVDINLVTDVINECIKWGFFNQRMYESHCVLTSKGFQKRYIEAAKRRKSITFVEDYLLIDPSVECKNVSHNITIVNADGNQVNVYINSDKCFNQSAQTPQSKVKKSKVKETKVDIKQSNAAPSEQHDVYPFDFESFWIVYPKFRRKDKANTFKTWKKKVNSADHQNLIECTKRYATDLQTIGMDGQFSKMPTTYLNAETWKDYLQGANDNESGGIGFIAGGSANDNQRQSNGQKPTGSSDEQITNWAIVTSDESSETSRSTPASSEYDQFVRR